MSEDFTILQWLGPELVKAGLVKNNLWVEVSAARAAKLTATKAEAIIATLFATAKPYAIDYLEQAPVLIIAASKSVRAFDPQTRAYLVSKFTAAIEPRPKVRDLLDKWKVPRPLRAVAGPAWRLHHYPLLRSLSHMPASTLAQAIPSTCERQRQWLDFLVLFEDCLRSRINLDIIPPYLEWAAVAATTRPHSAVRTARDVADYIANNLDLFSPRWTWSAALRRSDEWHDLVAKTSTEKDFLKRNGIQWTQMVSYGDLPVSAIVDDLTFLALQSGEQLHEDGRAMHHCVSTYASMMIKGRSRIYSVRRGGNRLATLELSRTRMGEWYLTQLKGPYNAKVRDVVAGTVRKFINQHIEEYEGAQESKA